MRYDIPSTVSAEAKNRLGQVYGLMAQLAAAPKVAPDSLAEWDRRNAQVEAFIGPMVQANAAELGCTVTAEQVGGVAVRRITPPEHRPDGRALLYVHGGGYVVFSAASSLTLPALIAAASGIAVLSIDYTLAPRGTWQSVTDEVLRVYHGVLADHQPEQVGLFGDSAGGALAAGAVLKMRDGAMPLPGALYLASPWSDITDSGDSCSTLAAADPSLDATTLQWGADAYAKAEDQRHPYVSPVYGDYSKPFPPTLIQGGTREIFLSHFVRHYQAIRAGGHEAVLDLYEGMPHVFQALAPAIPETATAIARATAFFDRHLVARGTP